MYLAVIQAAIVISMMENTMIAPNATTFQLFEISWGAAKVEFENTYREYLFEGQNS